MNKKIGYALLLIGLLLIIFPLWQTYQIFSGKALPAQVFKSEVIEPVQGNNNPFDIQQQMQKALWAMLPINLINNILNLSSWMILMVILMLGGGQIANLGVKLIL